MLLISNVLNAQLNTQIVRGQVKESILQRPIPGAVITTGDGSMGTIADSMGRFRLEDVPLGTITIKVSAVGYNESIIPSLQVISGKEAVLNILLDEKLISRKEVIIKGKGQRYKPMNEMSVVSARRFSVEETQKYAASVNDPARMATNFAGVASADDGNNQIVIRGNSPMGMQWRMEGIEIPNPNHFAALGSSGGGISILSAQLLDNSDFLTGAFAPEYGNVLSGVFDLSLRKGNNEKREYSAQLGLLGVNVSAEGPISSKSKSSYLINYRYSTLSILNKLGLPLTPSTTNFQDLSYHVCLPTKKIGTFSLFSFGGLSNQFFQAQPDSTKWKQNSDRYSDEFVSNTGMWGLSHRIDLGKKSYLKTVFGYSNMESSYFRNYFMSDYQPLNMYNSKYTMKRYSVSTQYNIKVSTRLSVRSGIIYSGFRFMFNDAYRNAIDKPMIQYISSKGIMHGFQGYTNLQYKLSDEITLFGGVHAMLLTLNNTSSVEPRLSVRWNASKNQTLSFGYGNHSQFQPIGVYFYKVNDSLPNRNLKFSRAHHLVLSHQFHFDRILKLKTEIYYQHLYRIPVSTYDTSTFSMLNVQGDYVREPLMNKGRGENYGVEVSLEKLLSRNFYYMVALSLYQSKYKTANSKQFDTRFNGNELINIVAGKDFISKQSKRTFGIHVKNVYAGGYRTTPIDIASSQTAGEAIYYPHLSYSQKLPAYHRIDLRLLMKWNAKKLTHTISLDIQNLTNRQNVFDRYYDIESASVKTYYQLGILPIINYKVEF